MGSTIGAGEFKATCLHVLEVVARQHEEVIITKRGRPIAKLVPIPGDTPLFGALAGSVLRQDDLVSPIGDPWEAHLNCSEHAAPTHPAHLRGLPLLDDDRDGAGAAG